MLAHPEAVENPFFLLVPEALLPGMIILATAATVIASQAVISGAFSATRQAIQLGLLPRMEIRHTSAAQEGQIYLPRVNLLLFVGVIVLVLSFRSSSALASAYGIAVSGDMVLTSIMITVVVSRVWGWGPWLAALVIAPFVVIDMLFFVANAMKLHDGGWLPLAVGPAIMTLMLTWRKGTRILFDKTRRTEVSLPELVKSLERGSVHRVRGAAVFLTSDRDSAPTALLHNLKHNKVLHELNVVLTIRVDELPRVPDEQRVAVERLSPGFVRMTMSFGFMESPDVPHGLVLARQKGVALDLRHTSFFLSRRTIRPAAKSSMPLWQDRIYILLARTATDATDFFRIPSDRVLEVGTQVTI